RHEHSQPVKARQGTRLLGWISVDPPSSTNTWVAFERAAAHSGADRRASSLVIHLRSSKNRESGNSLRSSNADAACGLTVLDSTREGRSAHRLHLHWRISGSSLRSSNADAACGLTVLDSTREGTRLD